MTTQRRDLRGQGLASGKADQGPDEPNQHCEGDGPEQGQEPAGSEKSEDLHWVPTLPVPAGRISMISTRRLRASRGLSGTKGSLSARPSAANAVGLSGDLRQHGRDRLRPGLRQVPVGGKAQGLDGGAVRMPGDQHLARELFQRLPDAPDQGLELGAEGGSGGREEPVPAQDQGLALGSVEHIQSLRDLVREQCAQGRQRRPGLDLRGLDDRADDGRALALGYGGEPLVQVGQRRVDRVRVAAQREGEGREEPEQQERRESGEDPQGELVDQGIALGREAAPVRRELRLRPIALAADGLVQPLSDPLQLVPAAVPYPVASLETHGEAQVHELE